MTDATRTAPISSHPAFKWGVGLWFALLLGLGLFVMPAALHQGLAQRLGIDAVVTDAVALRAILSGAAALLGLLIGLVLAMRVAAINEAVSGDDDDLEVEADIDDVWLHEEEEALAPPAASASAETPRRPFNPREDMDEEGIAAVAASSPVAFDEQSPNLSTEPIEPEDAVFEEIESDDDLAEPVVARDADPTELEDDNAAVETGTSNSAPRITTEALGDMSLDALTARLGAALEAFKTAPVVEAEDTDPVIAFLRREAERETPESRRDKDANDPQAELRSALDKLNRVGKSN
jgi:hypothetical protein